MGALIQRVGRTLGEVQTFQGDNICETHLNTLVNTEQFSKKFDDVCLWPKHPKSPKHNVVRPFWPVDLETVQDLWNYKGLLVLYGGHVCTTCHKRLNETLKEIAKEKILMENIDDGGVSGDDEENMPTEYDSSPTKASSTGSSMFALDDKLKELRLAINRVITLNKIKGVTVKDSCHQKFDTISVRRQNEILNSAGAAITAVIHSIYTYKNEDGTYDDGYFMKKLMEHNYVDKFLDNATPPSSLFEEV